MLIDNRVNLKEIDLISLYFHFIIPKKEKWKFSSQFPHQDEAGQG